MRFNSSGSSLSASASFFDTGFEGELEDGVGSLIKE